MIDWDIEELALRALGHSAEKVEQLINESCDTDELIGKKYEGVTLEQYTAIVKDLLPFTPQVQSAIAGNNYHAFVDAKEMRSIVKVMPGEAIA